MCQRFHNFPATLWKRSNHILLAGMAYFCICLALQWDEVSSLLALHVQCLVSKTLYSFVFFNCNGSSHNSLVILCIKLQIHGDIHNVANYRKLMNICDTSVDDSTDVGMVCDTCKVNILRTCTVPVYVIVNGQLDEELCLLNEKWCIEE